MSEDSVWKLLFKVSVYIPQWVIQVILNVESESSDGENTDESRNMGSITESIHSQLCQVPFGELDTDLSRFEILKLHFDLYSKFLPFKREWAESQWYQNEMIQWVRLVRPRSQFSWDWGSFPGGWTLCAKTSKISDKTRMVGHFCHCQLRKLHKKWVVSTSFISL